MQALKQQQAVNTDRYDIIIGRYKQYLDALNDLSKEPVRVFDPLSKKSLDELELIREVSQFLQNKKDEDLKKAEQAANQAEEEAKKAAEKQNQPEENKEESIQEKPIQEESKQE